jgi:hypothetical protein
MNTQKRELDNIIKYIQMARPILSVALKQLNDVSMQKKDGSLDSDGELLVGKIRDTIAVILDWGTK